MTCYKFFLAGMFLVGIGAVFANPIVGLVIIGFAAALFGSQQRREQSAKEERRHREMVEATRRQNQ